MVTYYGPSPGIGPLSDVTNPAFAQLDYCLVDSDAFSMISDIWTNRGAALPTRHFLMNISVQVKFGKQEAKSTRQRCCLETLRRSPGIGREYCDTFTAALQHETGLLPLDEHADALAQAMRTAAGVADVPERGRAKHWISTGTKELFKQRDTARQAGDRVEEQRLNASIKQSARRDKRKWLEARLRGGSW